jgi:hypothetical protein
MVQKQFFIFIKDKKDLFEDLIKIDLIKIDLIEIKKNIFFWRKQTNI